MQGLGATSALRQHDLFLKRRLPGPGAEFNHRSIAGDASQQPKTHHPWFYPVHRGSTLFLILTALLAWALAGEPSMSAAPETGVVFAEAPQMPVGFVALPGVYATVYGAPQDRPTLERLAEHAAISIPRIAQDLGIGAGPAMHIVLADDEQAFVELQPGAPPDWADGTAWPQHRQIFLKSPRIRIGTASPLEQVLDHEITHVLLGQAFGPRPVPRWLQEGLAQWVAKEIGPETTRRLSEGLLGELLTLQELTGRFPRDAVRANLAYAQSADLIAFVVQEYGAESIPVLVQEMAKGKHHNAAFRVATGEDADTIDQKWRARLESSPLWLSSVATDTFFFGLGAPLTVAAFWMARRRNRKTYEKWEAEDRLAAQIWAMWEEQRPSGPH